MAELLYEDTYCRLYLGDGLQAQPEPGSFSMALVDPPYADPRVINGVIRLSREAVTGVTLCFMYPEDVQGLEEAPEQVLHWVKPISTKNTSRRYSRFIEAIAVYDLERGYMSPELYWANRSGVFTDALEGKPVHPYEKPKSLIRRLILNHSKPGDSILDLCTGSGTVLETARELGRRAVGYEIEPGYAALAVARLQGGYGNGSAS